MTEEKEIIKSSEEHLFGDLEYVLFIGVRQEDDCVYFSLNCCINKKEGKEWKTLEMERVAGFCIHTWRTREVGAYIEYYDYGYNDQLARQVSQKFSFKEGHIIRTQDSWKLEDITGSPLIVDRRPLKEGYLEDFEQKLVKWTQHFQKEKNPM